MPLNPVKWPLAGKMIGVCACALALGGGVAYALAARPGSTAPSPAATSTSLSQTSAPETASPTPSTPPGLSAGCQLGQDNGGFEPASQQDYGQGLAAYRITVDNATGSPVTVSGFAVTFSAAGSMISSAAPTVRTAYIAPGERWYFMIDEFPGAGVQVSESTYLSSTCTVTSVTTSGGQVTPTVIQEQDGVVNTHHQDVEQAQQQLAADVSTLVRDSDSLNNNNTLASDVKAMQQEYGSEQKDWKDEQQGNCQDGSVNYGPVTGDTSAVGGYHNALKSDITVLQSGHFSSSIAQVTQDLAAVQGEVSTLQGLGSGPDPDPSSAVAAGNQALRNAAGAIYWAQGQGRLIDGQAHQLATTAQDYANNSCG